MIARDGKVLIEALLGRAAAARASDLHLVIGERPRMRLLGEVTPLADHLPLADADLEAILDVVAPEEHRARLRPDVEIDFGYEDAARRRYRVTAYFERRGLAIAFRVLSELPPALDELGVPRDVLRAAYGSGGLVLFAGHAGAGKTTTLASVLQELCTRRPVRAITLEDPIEYRLEPRRAWIEQREVGRHCPSFAGGVRDALEAAPDVLAIGELRDLDTIRLALRAAETGVLVLATVHAYDTTRAIGRIVDAFDLDERPAVRLGLAAALRTVVAQTLLRRADGKGRIPAVEVVHASLALATLVREGREHELSTVVEASRGRGMRTLDGALVELVRARAVTREEALAFAVHGESVARALEGKS